MSIADYDRPGDGVTSFDLGTRVSVRIGNEGETRLDGRLAEFYNGTGPIKIERSSGRFVIVPAHRIAWVESIR